MTEPPDPSTFLSGESGRVGGIRLTATRAIADQALRATSALTLTGRRLARLAEAQDPRRVLVVSVYRPGSRLPGTLEALASERHHVQVVAGAIAAVDPALERQTAAVGMTAGKFENLNRLLASPAAAKDFDWLLVVDDDVDLPHRFLDRYIALCERLRLDLSQPAQSMSSHAAWRVTRRRAFSLARITRHVEIGPVTAFSRAVAQALTPFPALRFGWGLDCHWGAVARHEGWRLGVIDALPVRHESRPVAMTYERSEAVAEAQSFLAGRPYVTATEAQQTVEVIRRLPA